MKTIRKLRKLNFIPPILYHTPEFEGAMPDPIPYMLIPKDKDMPVGVFIMENRQTGEYEPGPTGLDEEIIDGPYPHMFVDFAYLVECMEILFPNLDIKWAEREIRIALGLLPTKEQSRAAGEEILKKVLAKESELKEAAVARKASTEAKTNVKN